MYSYLLKVLVCLCLLTVSVELRSQMQKLKISDNNRFLVREDGEPFVWMGDTNWFFAKLSPSIIDSILKKRSEQGFTIMFVSCREKLYNGDGPGTPDNPNEQWWKYLDEYVDKSEKSNLYVGITLGWWGLMKKYSAADLFEYGKWVGNRYKDRNNIVWLTMGETGSHNRDNAIPDDKLIALVNGIREGDTGDKLLTVHADYQRGTSLSNDGDICDFNNWQTSQWCCPEQLPRNDERSWTVWEAIEFDYNKRYEGLPKPTLDSEAWYENNKDFCEGGSFNIRRRAYFTILAGGFGHTYGAGGIWDGLSVSEECSETALNALDYEGAVHMGYLSSFLHGLGRDLLKLYPNQGMIVSGNSDSYDSHIQASATVDQSFALIYSASDSPYELDVANLKGSQLSGIWYNPRTSSYQHDSGLVITDKSNPYAIDPPGNSGAGNDWLLILGDTEVVKKYAAKN
ncbi:apiosidase-like domain-containing protein [Poritiphilus flavus]|uniref:DUF4038 domain-containing protein n=1 Tax=Poritiphilus flavus TaxID=2697053 RepID=A0A6L9EGG0_9FLAO|nr:DUF4038 domain-containing protein [Poritiphilus flavus]NAS13746.1 DUF4038 domain-containing protein [Poritiphilus flavus]